MQSSQYFEYMDTHALSRSHQVLSNSFYRENAELQQLLHAVNTYTRHVDLSLKFSYESVAVFYGVYTANNSGLIDVQLWYWKFTKRLEVLRMRMKGTLRLKEEDEGAFERRLELLQKAADDVGRAVVNLEMMVDVFYRMNAGVLKSISNTSLPSRRLVTTKPTTVPGPAEYKYLTIRVFTKPTDQTALVTWNQKIPRGVSE
ncbi:hypothetical protein BDD12DRAFT_806111 [Trichophaea hybrida]|nr:hypothetical protein BDD12DRAFT_806111 [Trichophaea hybrida]